MRGTFAALLAELLVWVQYAGLDRTSEWQTEDRSARAGGLPSVFTGSLRAVLIDIAWVELLKADGHYAGELMDVIAALQPRSPDACVWIARTSAYTIADGCPDLDERWRWIRRGLAQLERGTRRMPDDRYLKFELARTLVHLATRREGRFDVDYIERIGRPFELAVSWYERALHRRPHVGLGIHPGSVDGHIYLAKYFQAWWCWRRGSRAQAAIWFRDSARHARHVFVTYPHTSLIYQRYARLCDDLAEAAEGRRSLESLDFVAGEDYGYVGGADR